MAEKIIEIPQINLESTLVHIVGKTPLLTNRFSERAMESIENKQQHAPKTAREARDPDADFKDAMHMIAEGVHGFPSNGIKKALVAAGGRFADEKMTHLRGVINIPTTHVEIQGPAPTMRSDPVRLQGMKFSVTYRPQYFPWEMIVPVMFNASLIGEAQVINLFQIAGFSVGLGSWRPECNGTFGQFTLASV
ncbi:hypothetical protein LGH83_04500 [Lichenihabitans sp. PAMC28606]|uniref:hypothetical protein n=1 Tax=Lichenihabitans sp. PAMC28606 TaxID=2880932 RepID=UPI001D0B9A5D|nr:hypothetical protein [Lichenihabitans sp. PAMC28606]UDL95487.1 hypothetical protein LGH83_04500 [Lichenihabitans sp. PAMC28606]